MNKQEVIKSLEKKRETALDNLEYYRDKENEKYEKMNRARVDSYMLAIQLVEQIDEPQSEKVEVPDFVAVWYESNKHKLERAIIDVACSMEKGEFPYNLPFEDWFIDPENHPIETLISMMKDGYTVKPKRWVVKFKDSEMDFYFMGWSDIYKTDDNPFVPNGYVEKDKDRVFMFDDRAKAEAVATLVDGSVEEV